MKREKSFRGNGRPALGLADALQALTKIPRGILLCSRGPVGE